MIASGREAGWDSGPAAQGPSPQRAGTGRRRDPPHAPRSNARTSPSRTYVPRHLEPLALAEYHPGEPAAATARTAKLQPQPRPPPQGSPGAPAAAQCMPGHVVPPGHGRARGILGVVVQRLTERVALSLPRAAIGRRCVSGRRRAGKALPEAGGHRVEQRAAARCCGGGRGRAERAAGVSVRARRQAPHGSAMSYCRQEGAHGCPHNVTPRGQAGRALHEAFVGRGGDVGRLSAHLSP